MRKKLRNALVIGMLMTLTVITGVASASPLQAVTASAYGAEGLGALALAPIAPTSTTFPPAANVQRGDLLALPLTPLAFTGTVSSGSQTANDTVLSVQQPLDRFTVKGGGPRPDRFNAIAAGRVEGLNLVLSGPLGGLLPGADALVQVGTITAEAAVSCVNGNPVVVSGSSLAGPLKVLGADLAVPVDNTLNQTIDLVNPLAAGVIELRRNVVDTNINGGVSVIGLQVRVLGTTQILNLAQARVEGGTCGPPPRQCKDGIDNDGDGKIDFNPPPGFERDPNCSSPEDDSESGLLPRTGGGSPMLGAALLALGGLMLLTTRKLRRSSI